MDVDSLYLAHFQMPLYRIPLGTYFGVGFPIPGGGTNDDILQKNHECPPWEENEEEIYVGKNLQYYLTSKSLVTPITYPRYRDES